MTSDQDLNGSYQFLATTNLGAEKHIKDTTGTQQNQTVGNYRTKDPVPSKQNKKIFTRRRGNLYSTLKRDLRDIHQWWNLFGSKVKQIFKN